MCSTPGQIVLWPGAMTMKLGGIPWAKHPDAQKNLRDARTRVNFVNGRPERGYYKKLHLELLEKFGALRQLPQAQLRLALVAQFPGLKNQNSDPEAQEHFRAEWVIEMEEDARNLFPEGVVERFLEAFPGTEKSAQATMRAIQRFIPELKGVAGLHRGLQVGKAVGNAVGKDVDFGKLDITEAEADLAMELVPKVVERALVKMHTLEGGLRFTVKSWLEGSSGVVVRVCFL